MSRHSPTTTSVTPIRALRRQLAAQPRPARRLSQARQNLGREAGDAGGRLDARERADVVPVSGTRSAAHLEECAAAADIELGAAELADLERALPLGFAAGERYSDTQWIGIQKS